MARPRKHGKWVDIAKQNGIPDRNFHQRIWAGWSPERAATEKVRKKKKEKSIEVITELEKGYICKFYDFDGASIIGIALNRKSSEIKELYAELEKEGLVDYYKKRWDEEYKKAEVSGWF